MQAQPYQHQNSSSQPQSHNSRPQVQLQQQNPRQIKNWQNQNLAHLQNITDICAFLGMASTMLLNLWDLNSPMGKWPNGETWPKGESVGPHKKMTRLGFEPRTSQLYTGCSNHWAIWPWVQGVGFTLISAITDCLSNTCGSGSKILSNCMATCWPNAKGHWICLGDSTQQCHARPQTCNNQLTSPHPHHLHITLPNLPSNQLIIAHSQLDPLLAMQRWPVQTLLFWLNWLKQPGKLILAAQDRAIWPLSGPPCALCSHSQHH